MNNDIKNLSIEEAAALLGQHPDFRVLRKFDPKTVELITDFPADAGVAVVLDTETTGKEANDVVIELGMARFAYNRATGEVYGVLATYNALEDPGSPIPPAASAVNGITDEMVAGKRIDDNIVEGMLSGVDFCVAHNAGFDRPKCEVRFPMFAKLPWACSFKQIGWAEEGISSAKLDYLANKMGFFFEAHRALEDSLALLKVLSAPLNSLGGKSALSGLLTNFQENTFRVWAVNSAYESKDLLKARGYHWSDGSQKGTEKAWFADIAQDAVEPEFAWLKENVYRRKSYGLPVDTHDALTRFSTRTGNREICYL